MIFPDTDCAVSASVLVGDDAVLTCMVDPAGELATLTVGTGFEIVMGERALRRLAGIVADGLVRLGDDEAEQADPD